MAALPTRTARPAALASGALALLLATLAAQGCRSPGHEATAANTHMFRSGDDVQGSIVDPSLVPDRPPTDRPPTAREQLEANVEAVLSALLPQVRDLHQRLAAAVEATPVPEVLSTNQPGLGAWRADRRAAYKARISAAYDETVRRLEGLHARAMETATARAKELAPEPSPLDDGPTGDTVLDQTLATFDEVLEGAVGLDELRVRKSQDEARVVQLFEVFTTFGSRAGADERPVEEVMQGRILLFVGGDETASAPRAVLVFRDNAGETPRAVTVAQVTRHRVMRGRTLVADYGWRPAVGDYPEAGRPATEAMGAFVIAPHVEPTMDKTSPMYDQLRDLRVVVDTQTGVYDEGGALLGGVDWRIEFSVSARGDLTWQLAGGRPVYDPYCAEVQRTLGR